jgi:hypothetical protein
MVSSLLPAIATPQSSITKGSFSASAAAVPLLLLIHRHTETTDGCHVFPLNDIRGKLHHSFNQGSKQDVDALVDYIYMTLGLDLNYIIPFAAVPENGWEIDGLHDTFELAHRIMLVNLLRHLGAIERQAVTRPTRRSPTVA